MFDRQRKEEAVGSDMKNNRGRWENTRHAWAVLKSRDAVSP